ncbi:hypothetical protein [Leifsonia sp. NPDC080035]|uniref:Lipoprotein n=1 Tax=Leifsonia sp. NPDC080035 TaxID=3143936 RepID=A0AAU7GAU0_9MICO
MRGYIAALVAVLVATTVTGCVAPPTPFDGERHARDELPSAVAASITDADPSTSRYQGEAAGRSLYLVRGTGSYQICLAFSDGTAEGSGSSCSGGDWLRVTLDDGAAFEVRLTGFPETPRAGEHEISRWLRQVDARPESRDDENDS